MIWGCLRCSLIYWLKLLHVANILTREVNTDSYERTLIQSKKTQKSKKRKKAKRIKKQNLDFHLGNQLLPQQSDSLSIDTSRLRCFHIVRHFIFTNLLKSFEFISFLVADTQLYKSLCLSVRRSVGVNESKSGKTRISAPAHPSATDGRVSGLVC